MVATLRYNPAGAIRLSVSVSFCHDVSFRHH